MGRFRTYQGSKNIAKKMLRDRGIYSPLNKAALDRDRLLAYESAVEAVTEFVREHGRKEAEQLDVASFVYGKYRFARWAPVSLDEYRAHAG